MHARVWMGMERFWTVLGEDPALAVALVEKLQALQIVAIDQATDRPGIGAWSRWTTTWRTVPGLPESPKFLRAHVFPFYKRIGEIVHSKGLPLMMHTDGPVNQIIPDLYRVRGGGAASHRAQGDGHRRRQEAIRRPACSLGQHRRRLVTPREPRGDSRGDRGTHP